MKLRRDHRIAAVTAVLAVGVPVGAACFIHARTGELAEHLGKAGEVRARIGAVDADLTGTIRVSDVGLGNLLSADSMEASVALDSLLAGQITADEIRVAGPHISIAVDRDGDSDLARLVRRLASHHTSAGSAAGSRVRRIVVSSGTLVAKIAGVGELSASSVELVPDAGGVRVITGALHVRGGSGSTSGEVDLARSAAEVSLPHLRFGRVLAVAGRGRLHLGDHVIALRDVSIGRLSTDANLEARGFLDDGGVPRSISAELSHRDGFALSVRGDRVPLAPFAALLPHSLLVTGARATGELTVRRAHDTVQLAVDGSVAGLRIDHKTIAPDPVPVDARVTASVTVSPQAIAVDNARLFLGDTQWSASGWLRRGSPLSGQLDVQLAPADCMDLVHAMPVEIRGPLDGIAMTGTLGGHARLSIDLAAPIGEGVELDTSLANSCEVTAEPPAANVGTLIIDRSELPDSWVSLSRLPRYVPDAFVSAEDGRFWTHAGFDVEQIARSFEIDLRDRKISRGGSTISQQLIKNTFLTQRRSFDRKVQEAVLTWRLEARLEKRTILERYLNIIELGPRMFGLRSAAGYWFGRSPRELTLKQAAFLAALTSEPTSMGRRVRQAGGLDPQSAERVDVILRAMYRDGVISKDDVTAAREDTMHFSGSALRHEI
ncbi:MAG TPA: transglycosylase domain-containing protein [Kofleriaceae bacterium]|nr:transglycosylase domain-containing protein [Kofleriaceae bacterium]